MTPLFNYDRPALATLARIVKGERVNQKAMQAGKRAAKKERDRIKREAQRRMRGGTKRIRHTQRQPVPLLDRVRQTVERFS